MNAPAIATLKTVQDFVEHEYLAHIRSTLAPSTVDGYEKMWNTYGSYFGGCELDIRTCDAQSLLRTICAAHPHLNKTTLRHAKNFFSGIWAHALRMGCTDRDNPWRSVQLPQAPDAGETYAYSVEEIETLIQKTPAPYDLVILLAATTGLRKSEIRGLRWTDWNAETSTLAVNRAVWRSHEKTTKSAASKGLVPAVPALATRLNAASRKTGYIFAGSTGKPLDLDNLARRTIVPAVGGLWRGYHAFRRGLATYLHARGIDDLTIQKILRHENVAVTQKCYVKTVQESVREAMSKVTFGEQK